MKIIYLTLLVFSISACSKDKEPEKVTTPWDYQIQILHELEKTEQLVLDAAAQRKKAMDEQLK